MTELTSLKYLTGFGNQHSSEAVPGALPIGRNSPQRASHGLYAELLSGSAFTAPRAQNQRTWLYRRQPAAVVGGYQPLAHALWKSGAAAGESAPPDPLRWGPTPLQGEGDFVDGLRSYAVNGEVGVGGMGALAYVATRAMGRRALVNADAEMLLVPQQGRLLITTELGRLEVAPGFIALLPRGMAFKVDPLDVPARGYVCENHGASFRLPELGPIGSNGLANPRDFEAPVAWYEQEAGEYEIVKRHGGQLWRATQSHSPFDVVAWHGNLVPCRYDLARFMTINTVSFDHPDPSIFTVLTSPSDTPGWANVDFVIFPPRWMVAEDTFRPPWYHRNVMSEFMGLVLGQYDAKPEGFKPGGASLHNSYVPHGPDAEAFDKASNADLKPHKLEATLAFMFETRWLLKPTSWALHDAPLESNYADCWQGLKDEFKA
ncbi:homogentisate 1,2-dioxygenase [Roseateles saccharophilus]|uniref:Homogentisate 1,2-dioxygenase n=1 Tax=Roseateles saccharophilus TaxID=304 RepID=A0A4R3UMD2_ROSSA|nr:homogentisate 1,2-dioxygenase [Roseateles saccharophilus]MDG0833932.1 homogentisate 1,2-dioxygenase [Roseateles saccharophilus]TCU91124.1 homogentisate 1,2-dioxygenase [Roseateles saccharophilus]